MSVFRSRLVTGCSAGVALFTAFGAGRWSAGRSSAGSSAVQLVVAGRPAAIAREAGPPSPPFHARETPPSPSPGQDSWSRLRAQPASSLRNAGLASRLRQLARTDPARAMALAAAERNLILRDRLLDAALRGWAEVAPDAAAKWAMAIGDPTKRGAAMAAVFEEAALNRPDEALRLGREAIQKDPGGATGHACALASALCAAGNFAQAATFAADPGELGEVGRSILTVETYQAWSQLEPEAAARAASLLADPAARTDALNAVVSGWGRADPASLTQFVAALPAGAERAPLLGQALRQWANLEPAAATAWLTANTTNLGADEDVAAVVTAGGFLSPAVAAEWTDGIASPPLRSQTALALLRTWIDTDPDAAKHYFEQTTALAPEDRRLAAALFVSPGSP